MLKADQFSITRPGYSIGLSGYVVISDTMGCDVDIEAIFTPYVGRIKLIEETATTKIKPGAFRCLIKAQDFTLSSNGRSYNSREGWEHYEVYSCFQRPEELTIYACKWQHYPALEKVKKYWNGGKV